MTKVVHCKREDFDILIDRSTPYGNMYTHLPNIFKYWSTTNKEIALCHTRTEAIEYFRRRFLQDKELQRLVIANLRNKTLGCHCKPKSCHGDVYVSFLNALDSPLNL